jgi:hypothetical protein
LEIYTAGVQPLEDYIDTALVLFRLILTDNCCVYNAVVQSAAVFGIEVLIPFPLESFLDICESIFLLMDYAVVESTQCVQSLMAIEH